MHAEEWDEEDEGDSAMIWKEVVTYGVSYMLGFTSTLI
jgi:hypothetical protein